MIWKEGILGKKLPMIFSQFLQESGSFVVKILQCVHKTWNKFSIIEYRRLFIYVHIYLFIHSFIK
jgi:hypothetical protein